MRTTVLLALALTVFLVSNCGEDKGTGPHLEWLTLNVDSVSIEVSSSFQFVATLDSETTQVAWYVAGTVGGDPVNGMITTDGLYIAPPEPLPVGTTVRVTARTLADTTVSASAFVTITQTGQSPYIQVIPAMATLNLGDSLHFASHVYNCSSDDVIWSVEKLWGSESQIGLIRTNGTYVAPTSISSSLVLLVRAMSLGCGDKIGIARINLIGSPHPFDVELEDFTDSLSLNGEIDRIVCGAASRGMAVWGLDSLGEYVDVPMKAPAAGQYLASVWYSASPGDSITVRVTVIGCDDEDQSEVYVLDEGTGMG